LIKTRKRQNQKNKKVANRYSVFTTDDFKRISMATINKVGSYSLTNINEEQDDNWSGSELSWDDSQSNKKSAEIKKILGTL
jgi:hypothetical protein